MLCAGPRPSWAGASAPSTVSFHANVGASPFHENSGARALVGPAGPPVTTGAAEGGVGSIVNVRAAESLWLPARS